MSEVGTTAQDEELSQVQQMLLTAVLRRQTLPGGRHPVELPDLAFVQQAGIVRVSTENVAGPLAGLVESRPIQVRSPESLRTEACAHRDIPYLTFQPAVRDENRIRLTLQGRIATRDAERRPLGLSGLQVEFHRIDDRWEVVNPPAAFAM